MQRLVFSLRWLAGITLAGALLAPVLAAPPSPTGNTAEESSRASSMSQLKLIGLALHMYAQDYDEVLPPMNDLATVKPLLLPYVRRDEAVFVHPLTHELFQPNPALSRRPLSSISVDPKTKTLQPPVLETRCVDMGQLAQVVAFYEATPAPDAGEARFGASGSERQRRGPGPGRAVLFLDGHVQVIPEAEWPRLKRASGIR